MRAQKEGWSVSMVMRLLSSAPAQLAGLDHRKGALRQGYDADIVVWDPTASADTSEAGSKQRHKATPYRDVPLLGRVIATIVGGAVVFEDGKGVYAAAPCGWPVVEPTKL